ncbi:MAG: DUF6492 family protein [Spirulinaceae cyanobacterium]
MSHPPFDFVIPLFRWRWNTQAVLEGLTAHYQPRSIHIIAPEATAEQLRQLSGPWQTPPLQIHNEETFFAPLGLTKERICAEMDLKLSLYTPGWFYQQLLKLGAYEGIADLSEWYLVWDSDLLPVNAWPIWSTEGETTTHPFALLQHKDWGNPAIVSKWAQWIETVLGVAPLQNAVGTFVPHHLWFEQAQLRSLAAQVQRYYNSSDPWLLLMMRSANDFGTFSEYWLYTSWVAAQAPKDLVFHDYVAYGATTERFFDDGTGLFSATLRQQLGADAAEFSPTYVDVMAFIQATYPPDPLPSSLSFESSPRHLKKDKANVHIEESRSRWNPREDLAMTKAET